MKSNEEELLRYHVKVGGGKWIGIQGSLVDGDPDLVQFFTPDGTVLQIDAPVCDSTQVRWAIAEHKRKQGEKPIKIQRSVLVHILDKLTELAEEVKQLIEEKR